MLDIGKRKPMEANEIGPWKKELDIRVCPKCQRGDRVAKQIAGKCGVDWIVRCRCVKCEETWYA